MITRLNLIGRFAAAFVAAGVCASPYTVGYASDLTVLSSVGMRGALDAWQSQYESSMHRHLRLVYGTAAPLTQRILEGERFDLAILTPVLLDQLASQGRVDPKSIALIARVGVGVAARREMPVIDISNIDAFKAALMSATSVAYVPAGQSGAIAQGVIAKLGLTDQLQPRLILETRQGGSLLAVTEGRAQLGIALISEIVNESNVRFLGPLPRDVQAYVSFSAGISQRTKDATASRELVAFMTGAQARSHLAEFGMESQGRTPPAASRK